MKSAIALIFMVFSASVMADALTLNSGIDISRGQYDQTRRTEIQVNYLQIRYEINEIQLQVDLPHLRVTGPTSTTGEGTRQQAEGLGDIVLSVSQPLFRGESGRWTLDAGGKIKLPTAEQSKGLGTGKTDYSAQLDWYYMPSFITYFASTSYTLTGDSASTHYHNPFAFSAGLIYALGEGWSVGSLLDYRQSVVSGLPAQREPMLFVQKELGTGWRVQSYVYGGTNSASPDTGWGFMLGKRF